MFKITKPKNSFMIKKFNCVDFVVDYTVILFG